MATDQYHEPPEELSEKTRNFTRIMQSLIEEAEAINWYEQRINITKDREVKEIMRHAQEEEFEHFAIDLAWVSRRLPKFETALKAILFKKGNIIKLAEKYEEEHE